jgi:tetratricopeptide (TPR) repeat protein
MKARLLYILLIICVLYSVPSQAQEKDSLISRAAFFYENEEYQLAILRINDYISHFPPNSMAYRLRGNCYRETGQNRLAINDYLSAGKLVSEDPFLIYNLGVSYDKLPLEDSAIYFFREFTKLKPDDPEGYRRLCTLFMYAHPEWKDSAIYFASKAVNTEPRNALNYNFLAMAYYSADQYKKALETALKGIKTDSSVSVLHRTAGICSFFLKDYPSAIKHFDNAYKLNKDDLVSLDYKIQTMLIQNTRAESLSLKKDGAPSFSGISSFTVSKMEKKMGGNDGPYNYTRLIEKFRNEPLGMGLDEFFMLYYGYSCQTGYTPDSDPFSEKAKQTSDIEQILVKDPTFFPLYLNLADFYIDLGNEEKYFENRYRYFGFTESIKATGDGLSPATAYVVTNSRHEYNIMVSLGYAIKSQSRERIKDHNFDILKGADTANKEVTVYFNVDKPSGNR